MTATPTRAPSRAFNPAVVVAVCFTIAALEGYDIQAVGVAAPTMGPALHLGRDAIGFAGSASMFGLVLGALVGGWLADRIGRKPVLVGSVVWFGVFSLVTVLARDAAAFMLVRFLVGLGFGGAMPNMIAVAADISALRRRAATVTTVMVGFPAGGSLAALVTRIAAGGVDWRTIFIVGGLLPLAVAPLAVWLLPETRPTETHAGDRRVLPALFGEGRAPATLLLWLAFAFTLMVQYVLLSWLPTLSIARGLDKQTGALAALCFNIAGIGGGLLVGRLVDRFGYRWPLALAYVGLAAAMAALPAAVGAAPILALSAAAGFAVMGALFSLYAAAPTYYALAVRGTGTGAAVGAGRVGAIVGPAIGGVLLTGGAGAGGVLAALLPMAVVAGGAALALTVFNRAAADTSVASPATHG